MTATTPSTALAPVQPTFAESERLLGSGCGRWKRVLPGCWWSGSCLTAVISREHDDGAASRLAPQPLACVPRISW